MNNEFVLPSYSLRTSALRPVGETYEDLSAIVKSTYSLYSRIEKVLSPYNAKQSQSNLPYSPPTRQYLMDIIGHRNISTLPDLTVNNMLSSAIRFCEKFKGKRQLPIPHSSTHHSIHYSESQFLITKFDDQEWHEISGSKRTGKNIYKITLENVNPIYVEDFRPQHYKFIIVRQKLSKTGVPSNNLWEILFFKPNYGFIIDWIDADINPRWAGVLN